MKASEALKITNDFIKNREDEELKQAQEILILIYKEIKEAAKSGKKRTRCKHKGNNAVVRELRKNGYNVILCVGEIEIDWSNTRRQEIVNRSGFPPQLEH